MTFLSRAAVAVALLFAILSPVGAADLMEVRNRPVMEMTSRQDWPSHLAALFEEAVLHDEIKRPRGVVKWVVPIDLSLRGDAAADFAIYVETIAAELSGLIDLPIELYVDQNWAGNIDIYVTYWENYWPYFMQSLDPEDRIFTCAAVPWVDHGTIKRSTIKINAGVLDDPTTRACLLEELLQSLGLFGETEIETQTILHDGVGYEGLGEIDRLLIRTLYDQHLTPGMTIDTAMPIAKTLIDRWLANRTAPQ